jgi:pantoate--beta-alanine ligase
MKIINQIFSLRKILNIARARGKTVGFVPTMGALHRGHAALLRRCRRENDLTVLSIFVNPLQFGPHEDFRRYPRDLKHDVLLAKKENVDIIFHPSAELLYPKRYLTYIDVREITERLCGKTRPGHFRGVATVVGKLLHIINPDVLYLGQKDAQQCAVLDQMIRDLNFATKVRIVPTVRESDGLALSSRNAYLNAQERQEASILYQALKLAKSHVAHGQRQAKNVEAVMRDLIQNNTRAKIDYVACVNADTLQPIATLKGRTLIALAVFFGKTRLIDNIIIRIN